MFSVDFEPYAAGLAIGGAVASVVGAAVAVWQACRAVSARGAIERYKANSDSHTKKHVADSVYEQCVVIEKLLIPFQSEISNKGRRSGDSDTVELSRILRTFVAEVFPKLSELKSDDENRLDRSAVERHINQFESSSRSDEFATRAKTLAKDIQNIMAVAAVTRESGRKLVFDELARAAAS